MKWKMGPTSTLARGTATTACGAALVLVFALAFVACACVPAVAFAVGSAEAREGFSDEELSRLFEQCEYSDCEFVMYDCATGEEEFLKVRDCYSDRYEELVGTDEVDILSISDVSSDAASPLTVFEDRPLERLDNTSSAPWRDVLHLSGVLISNEELNPIGGSAFMVSGKTAFTAAHCVYQDGQFVAYLAAQADFDNSDATGGLTAPSRIVVSRAWVDSASGDSEDSDNDYDFDHDFALLVFDSTPPGASGEGLFSYESISIADSLALAINCAGYLADYGEDEGVHLYRNLYGGKISLLSPLPAVNVFHMDLSTEHGMSGGPVYAFEDGLCIAVGIVSYEKDTTDEDGTVSRGWNYACRVTERLQVLEAWAEEEGFSDTAPEQEEDQGSQDAWAAEESAGTIGIFQPSDLWMEYNGDK